MQLDSTRFSCFVCSNRVPRTAARSKRVLVADHCVLSPAFVFWQGQSCCPWEWEQSGPFQSLGPIPSAGPTLQPRGPQPWAPKWRPLIFHSLGFWWSQWPLNHGFHVRGNSSLWRRQGSGFCPQNSSLGLNYAKLTAFSIMDVRRAITGSWV